MESHRHEQSVSSADLQADAVFASPKIFHGCAQLQLIFSRDIVH